MRIRATFSKTEDMRFTGHLDLFRTLARTMRRANLPLVYSQGFNARPKIMLASALPLGYTSQCELVDFWLENELPLEDLTAALRKAAPPGIEFLEVRQVDLDAPKLQNDIRSAEFEVTLGQAVPGLETKVAELLAQQDIPREKVRKRKARMYNLRELIYGAEVMAPTPGGKPRLKLTLRAEEGFTGRPDDVLDYLDIDPLVAQVHRVAIRLASESEE